MTLPSSSSFCVSVLELVRILDFGCMHDRVRGPCTNSMFLSALISKKMKLMWFLHFLLICIPQWTWKIKPFNGLHVNPNPYDLLLSIEYKKRSYYIKLVMHWNLLFFFFWHFYIFIDRTVEIWQKVNGKDRVGAGSGKVHEAEFELGTPEALLHHMSACQSCTEIFEESISAEIMDQTLG